MIKRAAHEGKGGAVGALSMIQKRRPIQTLIYRVNILVDTREGANWRPEQMQGNIIQLLLLSLVERCRSGQTQSMNFPVALSHAKSRKVHAC